MKTLSFRAAIGRVVVLVALCVCGVRSRAAEAPAQPRDWPRWRGVDGAGAGGAATFPHAWQQSDWAWTATLPGQGHASPVIWRGRIYTASADEASGRRFVSCHATADGQSVWQREIPGPIEPHHAQNSSASGSVTVDQAGVYWLWATKEQLRVEAFAHDGEPKWHVDLGPYASEHGFGASAAVWRDRLIVPIDQDAESAVVALDTASGREVWKLPRRTARTSYATPLVIEGRGEGSQAVVVLASMSHGLTGIDPATGRVLWERKCFPKRTVSSPVAAGPFVIGTCGEGGGDNTLVAVRPGTLAAPGDPQGDGGPQPPEPELAYQLDRSVAPYVPTPVCSGRRLYLWGDRGVVTCVAVDDGSVLWRGRVGGIFSASPIVVGGTVVNTSAEGEIVVLADGDAFEVLGRTSLGEPCRATAAVADGKLFFRSVGRLHALDAR